MIRGWLTLPPAAAELLVRVLRPASCAHDDGRGVHHRVHLQAVRAGAANREYAGGVRRTGSPIRELCPVLTDTGSDLGRIIDPYKRPYDEEFKRNAVRARGSLTSLWEIDRGAW